MEEAKALFSCSVLQETSLFSVMNFLIEAQGRGWSRFDTFLNITGFSTVVSATKNASVSCYSIMTLLLLCVGFGIRVWCKHVSVWVCSWSSQSRRVGVFYYSHLVLSFSLNQKLASLTGLDSQQALGSACFCSPVLRYRHIQSCLGFQVAAWDMNSGSYACKVGKCSSQLINFPNLQLLYFYTFTFILFNNDYIIIT